MTTSKKQNKNGLKAIEGGKKAPGIRKAAPKPTGPSASISRMRQMAHDMIDDVIDNDQLTPADRVKAIGIYLDTFGKGVDAGRRINTDGIDGVFEEIKSAVKEHAKPESAMLKTVDHLLYPYGTNLSKAPTIDKSGVITLTLPYGNTIEIKEANHISINVNWTNNQQLSAFSSMSVHTSYGTFGPFLFDAKFAPAVLAFFFQLESKLGGK